MYYASPSSINRDGHEMLLRIGASANNPVISGTTSARYNAGASQFEQRNTESSFLRWGAHSTPNVFVWHRNVILLPKEGATTMKPFGHQGSRRLMLSTGIGTCKVQIRS